MKNNTIYFEISMDKLTRMLLYMLPLLWARSTLTLTMQESSTWRLYTGSEVMDTERLWWEAFGRAPLHDEDGEHMSAWQSEDETEGVGESGDEAAEEQGEDEEEEDKEEKASDTLLHELWKDCGEDDREIETRKNIDQCHREYCYSICSVIEIDFSTGNNSAIESQCSSENWAPLNKACSSSTKDLLNWNSTCWELKLVLISL